MAENLTSFPTRMHPVLQSLPVLILSPHARCNCRCIMCDIWKRTCDDRLSVEDVERLLDDVQNLRLEWVVLSGGEPLMHSDLFDICRALRRRGIRVTLLSTGLLLHRYAEQITAHVNDVIVSLDGPPAVHDTIRRVPGAFTILEEGIRRLLESDAVFPISARCV
ncbi:MAG: radical SAM protein, partial [Acidobacteriaceae bacterium]|nr:radical SAM protein [Acidobacteriaceae bacterium]